MDAVLGLSLTHTGWVYPFFGTLLGWLGVALTGTDAGSNALFGNLQKVTAEQLGLSPILMASANTTGGVMGKMIDAQSIVVASIATHQEGNEAAIFKAVFWHSLTLASLVGVLVMLYAYVWPWVVPHRLTPRGTCPMNDHARLRGSDAGGRSPPSRRVSSRCRRCRRRRPGPTGLKPAAPRGRPRRPTRCSPASPR